MPTDPNNERYEHDFADGEYGWGEGTATKDGYQDIIDQLEHDVPVVAPESEIEQYRSLPGRRFVAEDSNRKYIGDGSAWRLVKSSGPNPMLQSATVEGPTNTEELFSKFNGGPQALSPWLNPQLQSEGLVPMPQFKPSDNNPLFQAKDLPWVSTGEITYPTVIRVGHILDNPLGEYYLYCTPHDSPADGLGMLYADDPEGPWTDYANNPIDSDVNFTVGESTIFWDSDEHEFKCYFNVAGGYGENPQFNTAIGLTTSTDGINWSEGQIIIDRRQDDNVGHAGYKRALRTDNGVYLYGWSKWGGEEASSTVCFSEDGVNNWTEIRTYIPNEPTGSESGKWMPTCPTPYMNGYLFNYSGGDGNRRMGFSTDGFEIQDIGIAVDPSEDGYVLGDIANPDLLWDDGKLYMHYWGSNGKNDGTGGIGCAVANFTEMRTNQ